MIFFLVIVVIFVFLNFFPQYSIEVNEYLLHFCMKVKGIKTILSFGMLKLSYIYLFIPSFSTFLLRTHPVPGETVTNNTEPLASGSRLFSGTQTITQVIYNKNCNKCYVAKYKSHDGVLYIVSL